MGAFRPRVHDPRCDGFEVLYSEFFDGNPTTLNAWATEPPVSGRSLVADFPIKFALQEACNGFHARPFDGAGYASWRPDLACTFVDNPDTDTSPGQQVISNKLLGYAFLLTVEKYPSSTAKIIFPLQSGRVHTA